MPIEIINPATGKLIRSYQEYSKQEIDSHLDRAQSTFTSWKNISFHERGKYIKRAAQVLRQKAKKYAASITEQMGKPISQSLMEVEKCASVCDYYADFAKDFLAPRPISTDADQSFIRYDPLGPVLAVMPWNFPLWQVFRFAAPALMAGNVCLLKHASNVPGCALDMESIFSEAGLPTGAFTTLLISASTTKSVIQNPRVKAVTLTGSELAGIHVAKAAGETLKKTVLELGGSDPFIVLEDADIQNAAKVGAFSRLINTGQTCISAKRFIVRDTIADKFIQTMKDEISQYIMGDPMDPKTQIGPMAREDLRTTLHDQVIKSVEMGAKIELGGEIPDSPGYFYPPTLLTNVNKEMPVFKEETFGPVTPIFIANSDKQAIEMANDTPYGLGATLFTQDLERAHDLVRQIDAGSVFVNGFVKSDLRLPFGGVKASGYGRELAEEGIREFVNIKTVWMAK